MRNLSDYIGELNAGDATLELKQLAGAELLDENISGIGRLGHGSDAFGSDDETDLPFAPLGTEENMESLSDANKHDANNEDVKEEDEASDEDGTGQDVCKDFYFSRMMKETHMSFH